MVLLSGGLDSLLALKLMAAQGLRALALHTVHSFQGTRRAAERAEEIRAAAAGLGAAETVFVDITDDVIALTKRPMHGWGRNLNACIDCRLRTLRAAADLLASRNADFIATGEVLGQRPMSQRRDAVALADRAAAEWGLGGKILRPLCARALPATIPETEGWVSGDYLFDITGRGREKQIELARQLGVTNYPSPAGGCLLTDRGYAGRLAALAAHKPDWRARDAEALKNGRTYWLGGGDCRAVVGRNESENERLAELAGAGDVLLENAERPGATVLLLGERSPEAERTGAGWAVWHSKSRDEGGARVRRWRMENGRAVPDGEAWAQALLPPDEGEMAAAAAAELRRLRGRGRLD